MSNKFQPGEETFDDVSGHRYQVAGDDEGTEGHRHVTGGLVDDDEVEGHKSVRHLTDDDEVEGHKSIRHLTDDDDDEVEGHRQTGRA